MAKKILFTADSYINMATANGVCVKEVIGALGKKEYEIHVLCFNHGDELDDEIVDGIYIHRIQPDAVNLLRYAYEKRKKGLLQTIYKTAMKFLNRLETAIFLSVFPMRSPVFAMRCYCKVKALHKKYRFNAIVASYCPFETVYAGYRLKKAEGKKLKLITYYLDSISNQTVKIQLPYDLLDKIGWNWEKRFFNISDLVINMKCHEKRYNQGRYHSYRKKMCIADVPQMVDHQLESIDTDSRSIIRVVYAGLLRENLVEDMFELISGFLSAKKMELYVYGRSTISSVQKYLSKEALSGVHFEGFLPHEMILEIENKADVLISMGNTGIDFVPSKIFEYMSFGGKIIHFYNYDEDAALPYYNLYPNSCCIDVRCNKEENIQKLKLFMDMEDKRVPFSKINEIFYMNTPDYTANLIRKVVG